MSQGGGPPSVFELVLIALFLIAGNLVPPSAQAKATRPAGTSVQEPVQSAAKNPTRQSRNQPLTFIARLDHAPFPYTGKVGDTDHDFFDYVDPATGERFHTGRNGERFSETACYGDSSVLFHLPNGFSAARPLIYVVFFHGILTEVNEFVRDFYLVDQVENSGRNAILIVPQLAKHATDTSPGKFFQRKAFRRFMDEVSQVLAARLGRRHLKKLNQAPVILAAFSGGYKATALVLDRGGLDARLKGVMLLDALYDDVDRFEKWWLKNNRRTFLLNIFGAGSCEENSRLLADGLVRRGFRPSPEWPRQVDKRGLYFIRSNNEHLQIPLLGPPERPLEKLLRNLAF
ncbi:MAG: hypothetical protein AB1641_22960 [Thermodesulfobacteriota bacterium]